jgi:hypothetical protein
MKLWVFAPPMMIGEWAYSEALNPVFGEAPRCPSCGKFIGMEPWLPPYRARLRKGTRTGTPADVITGADFDTFIAAERFVANSSAPISRAWSAGSRLIFGVITIEISSSQFCRCRHGLAKA